VAAVAVDSPERNAAMAARWFLPFPIHSDPGGEQILQPLGLWNAIERGGIGWPAVLVYDRDGNETARFRSRDFADRPPELGELLDAVRALGLPPVEPPPPWEPEVAAVEDPGALRLDAFGPYFRGIRFSSAALSSRFEDEGAQQEARRMSAMAAAFLDAWRARRQAHGS
jgi:hypothetical protein